MEKAILTLADSYIILLAWFMTGMPSPFIKESYRLKAEIEIVLRKLTGSQLTGVELARCARNKYSDPPRT